MIKFSKLEGIAPEDIHGPILKKMYRIPGVLIAKKLKDISWITPNQITFLKTSLILPVSYFFYRATYPHLIYGAIILLISFVLDYTDGALARLRGQQSPLGAWLDHPQDDFGKILMFFAITLGLYNLIQNILIWIYGFLAITSYLLISLQYLYYKNFFTFAVDVIEKEKARRKFTKQFFFIDPFVTTIIILAAFFNQFYYFLIFSAVYGWIFAIITYFLLTRKAIRMMHRKH